MNDMSQHQGASGPAAFVCLFIYLFLAINKYIYKILLSKARKPGEGKKAYVKDGRYLRLNKGIKMLSSAHKMIII